MTRIEKRKELFEQVEGKLPPEQLTDFNLDRWLDAYDEDVPRCVEVIGEYLKNRKALGLDLPNAFDDFYTRPDMSLYYGIFNQSRPTTKWINSYDNGIVFVETGVPDANKLFLQILLEQEKRTGKRSPGGICIFDMGQMSILQYSRIGILMSFYAEVLGQVVIVNPPRLLNALMKIMSILLPTRVLSRFKIAVSHSDMQKWISPDAVPVAFGGTRYIEDADLPETGCNAPKELGKDDFLRDGEIWERHGIKGIQYDQCIVADSWVKEMDARRGQTLLFEYFANRNFEIIVTNEAGEYLFPRLKMCSPLLAEEGEIKIQEDGRIRWELKNLSRMMRMKLRIALRLIH